MADTKFSQFTAASGIDNADVVVGVQSGANTKFSFSTVLAWIRQSLTNIFVPSANVGVAGGVAGLDANGKVPTSQLPPIASTAEDVTYDNTNSGLTADDVQEAIDELAAGTATGKADEDTIAPVEASTTATAAHPLGSIFYLSGVLYRALFDIGVGDTINTGSGGNATQTSVALNFKRVVTLTSAQYTALSAAEKAADIVYIVTDKPMPEISTDTPQMDGTGAAGSTGEVSDSGHVHPSDTSKADKTDLSSIQATGSTNATGAAISAGTYFYLNGVLVQAIGSGIASGAAFTLNTNYKTVPGGGLNNLFSKVAKYTHYSQPTAGTVEHPINQESMVIVIVNSATHTGNGSVMCYGIVSAYNSTYSNLIEVQKSSYNATTVTGGAGKITITTTTTNLHITVIECPT